MTGEEEKTTRSTQLGQAPLGRLLLSMSVQTTVATLLYSLYSVINTVYVARGIGSEAAGGLAITFPLVLLLAGMTSTLGNGAASVVSRALGRRDVLGASAAAANAFLVFYAAAILVTVVGLVFLDPLLNIMGVTESLRPYARDYLQIILIGSVTSTAFSSIIRAEGNTRFAMLLWIIPVAVNIILDPVFIFALHAGVRGAAAATVIAQSVSVAMSVYYFFFSGKSALHFNSQVFQPNAAVIREVFSIGVPSLIQMISAGLSVMLVNNVLRVQGGSLAISSYGIVYRFMAFLIIPQTGVVQAVQPMIGYNAGAGRTDRVRRAATLACLDVALYGLLAFLAVRLSPGFWIGIFTSESDVLFLGTTILKAVTLTLPIAGIQSVAMAHFQALGKVRTAVFLALAQNVLVFLPVLLIFSQTFGITGIWYAFPISATLVAGLSICLLAINLKGSPPPDRRPRSRT